MEINTLKKKHEQSLALLDMIETEKSILDGWQQAFNYATKKGFETEFYSNRIEVCEKVIKRLTERYNKLNN